MNKFIEEREQDWQADRGPTEANSQLLSKCTECFPHTHCCACDLINERERETNMPVLMELAFVHLSIHSMHISSSAYKSGTVAGTEDTVLNSISPDPHEACIQQRKTDDK